MIDRVEVLQRKPEVIIDHLTLNPKLESLVQSQQNAMHQRNLASKDTLAQKLWMEDRKRTIQALNRIKDIPLPLFAKRQPQASNKGPG